MDRVGYINKRKGRYMAQILEGFEEELEPALIEAGLESRVNDFKGLVRARITALATDAATVIRLGDDAIQNGLTLELRDQLHPTGQT